MAEYLYAMSRTAVNPQTGKKEPILNKPTVEDFIGFATKNYLI